MKVCCLVIPLLLFPLTFVNAKEKPHSYFSVGFGTVKMQSKWIKSYSVGMAHDFNLSKKSTMAFGVFMDNYRLNTEYDVDTNYIPQSNITNFKDDSRRLYNLNFKATSIHLSINYKYWLKKSKNSKYYIEGGIITNLILNEYMEYEFYYRGYPHNTLYPGPYHYEGTHKPNHKGRFRNTFRPGIGFGYLRKITYKNYLSFQLYLSHTMQLQTVEQTSFLYPRISVGFTF